jgi:sec-independent protein translocase protein TatC
MVEEPDPFAGTRMTLGEHLEELRSRLFKCAIVFVVVLGAAFYFKKPIAEVVIGPFRDAMHQLNERLDEEFTRRVVEDGEPWERYFLDEERSELKRPIDDRPMATGVGESFVFALNNAIYASIFIGSPFFLWQMWLFIAAGLYPHEKRGVRFAFPISLVLFVTGVVFAFLVIVPLGLYFLNVTLEPDQVTTSLKLDQYFGFVRALCLAMGTIFQLPILMVFAARFGLVEPATFAKYRAHWVVIALIIAALLTPGPDFYSQVLMAIPMLLLYEIGIQLGRFLARPRKTPEPPA